MPYTGEARIRYGGPPQLCAPYIRVARVIAERVVAMFDVPGSAEAATRTVKLDDGTVIRVTVFEEVPPILTIIPVVPEGEEKRPTYRWPCVNGLYVAEDLKEDTLPGHGENTLALPNTFVVASLPPADPLTTHKRIPLQNNRFDPAADYVLRPGKATRGISVVPVETPVGPAFKSGTNGLLCFTGLGQTGFFWNTVLPANRGDIDPQPKWYKCFLRTAIGTPELGPGEEPVYLDPAYTSPLGRTFDHTDVSVTSDTSILTTVVVDFFGLYDTPSEVNLLDTLRFEIPIHPQEVESNGITYEWQAAEGRLRMVWATASTVELAITFAVFDGYPETFSWDDGAGYARDMAQDTARITLNSDGTHTVSNVWDSQKSHGYVPHLDENWPIRLLSMDAHLIDASYLDAFPSRYAADVVDSLWCFVYTETLNSANTATEYVVEGTGVLELVNLPVPLPPLQSSASGDMVAGTYHKTSQLRWVLSSPFGLKGFSGAWGPGTWTVAHSYDVLPVTATPYGACRVEFSADTTNEIVGKPIADSTEGSITWRKEANGDGFSPSTSYDTTVSPPGSLDVTHEFNGVYTMNATITVTAFGFQHTIPITKYAEFRAGKRDHVYFDDHASSPSANTATKMWFTYDYYGTTNVEFWGSENSWGSAVENFSLIIDGDPVPYTPPTKNYTNVYRSPVIAAYIDDGILYVEFEADEVPSGQNGLRGYVADSFRDKHYGRKWGFTTAGEKFVVHGYTTTDPTGDGKALDLAHNPDTKQTYKIMQGEPYACMRQVTEPGKYISDDRDRKPTEILLESDGGGIVIDVRDLTND